MKLTTSNVLCFFIYILSCLGWYLLGYKLGRLSVPKEYNIVLEEKLRKIDSILIVEDSLFKVKYSK